jgi:PQQ-dependent catabolism-associated CXXCW motif protein
MSQSRRWTRAIVVPVLALLAFAPHAGAGEPQAGPELDPGTGYRIARYRAPVPETVPGGTRVDIDRVEELIASGAVLIDVMAAEGGGPDPETGRWRLVKPRENIPGSTWLADVGKGVLDPGLESYFRTNLERLTQGDKARAIVIYCLADCWMGWNAARRAASWGYTAVNWYPEGTDGWRDWDGRLTTAEPEPMAAKDVARCVPRRMPETGSGQGPP